MRLATYIVAQGDTLEVLSQKFLGDASLVGTLIQINKLRYPYISDNPYDQFSGPKGTVLLTQQQVNSATLNINNPNSIVILPNDTVFIYQGKNNASGAVLSASASTINFNSALLGTFDQAAVATIFSNQQNVATQVLKTGDTLFYPLTTTNLNATNSLLLGTDWKLDENGYLVKSGGDIGTVSGIDNLSQAISLRARTPYGSLNLHKDYGNRVFGILGEAGAPHFRGLAKHYIEECVSQDVRVRRVKTKSFSVQADAFDQKLDVIPVGSQDPITQPLKIPIGGT